MRRKIVILVMLLLSSLPGLGLYLYATIPKISDESIHHYIHNIKDSSSHVRNEEDSQTNNESIPSTSHDSQDSSNDLDIPVDVSKIKRADNDALSHIEYHNQILTSQEKDHYKDLLISQYENYSIDELDWKGIIPYLTGTWKDNSNNSVYVANGILSVNEISSQITDSIYNGRIIRLSLSNGSHVDYDVISQRMMILNTTNIFNPNSVIKLLPPYGIYVSKTGDVLTIDTSEVKLNGKLVQTHIGYISGPGGGFYQDYRGQLSVNYPFEYDNILDCIITKNGAFTKIY